MPTFDDILSDPYFAKLDRELSKFNIFHATDMKNREIKHTKFLGYLLDPNESHQLGTKFLWQFLRKTAAIGIRHLDLLNLNLLQGLPTWSSAAGVVFLEDGFLAVDVNRVA